jgi:arginyl-tRNA synthetase
LKENLIQKIKEILVELGVKEPKIILDYPTYFELGDFTTNVAMVHAKELGIKPIDLANKIKTHLEAKLPSGVAKINVLMPGFINFFISPKYFSESVGRRSYGSLYKGRKFFVEHTTPNPFKIFHIGHLMDNIIGEAIGRIIKANGADLKVCTYHGDVGLHVAKAVWAMKQGIALREAYTYGNKAYEESEVSKQEITETNKTIYDESDPEIMKVYEAGRKESFDEFEKLYEKLDSHFDYHFFESQTGLVGEELVRENVGKVFVKGDPMRNKDSQGGSVSNGTSGVPIIFKGENFEPKTHTRVFLTSEGLPTYEAKELGLAKIKRDWFDFDISINITANEIDTYFQVIQVVVGLVLPNLKGKLKHLSHGVLKLPSGKMSSREGNIISAEDLISEVKEKVEDKIRDRELNHSEIEEISETVALGAIRYTILRQAIGGDIIFDFDKSISFEGDSGPYLQYATVRANSILNKATPKLDLGVNGHLEAKLPSVPNGWVTTNLERILERFLSVVERAGKEFAPNHLVTYLIELAGEFNSFYAKEKIIDENDPTSPYRLYITKRFVEVMTEGLSLLAIKVPEKM